MAGRLSRRIGYRPGHRAGDGYVLSLPAADPAAGSVGECAAGSGFPSGHAAGRLRGREAVAYGAAVFDGEPAYAGIEGRWLTDGAYVVLHRLAVAGGMQGRGLATAFLRRVGELARRRGVCAFRVDTNFDNRRMLRLLEKEGFRFCGTVRYAGGERLAFEKRL